MALHPRAGDALLIKKVKMGNGRVKTVPETRSIISVVYEDGTIRSKEGDIFHVRLLKRPTRLLRALWVTTS